MSPSERRQRLLNLLNERGQDTVENLAAELGVSGRTIRRDIEVLTLEYPIETVCGRYGGGVRFTKGFRLNSKRLTAKEENLLRRLSEELQGEDLETMKYILRRFTSY